MNTQTVITQTSNDTLEAVCERLPVVSQKYSFGVLGVHNLKEKMASKGVAFDSECRVFEVCNPQQAKEILTKSMELSTVLPCRISVYQDGNRTVLAAVKPTLLLGLFDAPGAVAAAKQVEDTMAKIIEETARGK